MAKVYVASSWSNEYQPRIVAFLREREHEVYDFRNPKRKTDFRWSQISGNWEKMGKRCFVSPHKSYLVNMEHIVYATGTAVFLSSGHQLPISRRKRQEFNQIFNAYLGR